MSFGQKGCPKSSKDPRIVLSQRGGQRCFFTPGRVPTAHCYCCSLPSQGGAVAACSPADGCCRLEVGVPWAFHVQVYSFLVHFPTLSHHFPKHGPRSRAARWEGAAGFSPPPTAHGPSPSSDAAITLKASLPALSCLCSSDHPSAHTWAGMPNCASRRSRLGYECLCFQRVPETHPTVVVLYSSGVGQLSPTPQGEEDGTLVAHICITNQAPKCLFSGGKISVPRCAYYVRLDQEVFTWGSGLKFGGEGQKLFGGKHSAFISTNH